MQNQNNIGPVLYQLTPIGQVNLTSVVWETELKAGANSIRHIANKRGSFWLFKLPEIANKFRSRYVVWSETRKGNQLVYFYILQYYPLSCVQRVAVKQLTGPILSLFLYVAAFKKEKGREGEKKKERGRRGRKRERVR